MTDAYGHYDAAEFDLHDGADQTKPATTGVVQYQPDGERDMRCGRCGKPTGNNHQSHYWKFCKVTGQMETFHFCCPGDCDRAAAWRQQYEVLVKRFAELGITVSEMNAFLVPPSNERWRALRTVAEQLDRNPTA